jgi:LacI family transcriptional regulator
LLAFKDAIWYHEKMTTILKKTGTGKSKVIVLLGTERGYRRRLLRGISSFFKLHGHWDVYLSQALSFSEIFKLMKGWNPDGLICDALPSAEMEKFLLLKIPVVAMGMDHIRDEKIGHLVPDNIQMGKMAAEYFLEKAFKSYAFCGYNFLGLPERGRPSWSRQRLTGFWTALDEKGFSAAVHENPIEANLFHGDERKLYKEKDLAQIGNWLKELPRPVAVFACNDARAGDVITAAKLVGLEVPDQVAVLGVDDDEFVCDFFTPPISSIAYNIERTGYEAAQLLEKLIQDQKVDSLDIFIKPTHVTERQSTDSLQIEDPDVRSALRYIHDHSNRSLQIRDILEHVAISRRTLELKFAKTLGHTLHDEIHKGHLQQIKKLLTQSNIPIFDIARSLGYTSEQNISRLFRQAIGCTPREYRKQFGRK